MLLTPHTALGAALASKFPNPLLSFPLIIIAHFLSDKLIPHWNPHIYTELRTQKKISHASFLIIIADFLLSLLLTVFFASQFLPNLQQATVVFFGGLLGLVPDSLEAPFYFLGSKNKLLVKYVNFHHRFQCDVSPFFGIISQLFVIIICWFLLRS